MTAKKKTTRRPLVLLAILLVGAGVWWALQRWDSAPEIRHVVLISLDTCRADRLSCYGFEKATTPNIDALAGEGHLFTQAMTPVPLTLPAHASMLTGTTPPHHGKHENKDVSFDPMHVTLAQRLKAKGYRTGAFVGAQVLNARFGLDRGFDLYDDRFENRAQSERPAEAVNRAAFAWLEKQTDQPVFLFLHYYDPHDAYEPPEPFATTFQQDLYAGEIAYTDHCIGQVVAKLKALDMYESSLIIVTGDHGEMLGEHGELTHMYFIYQAAMQVPMVYKLPGARAPRKIDALTSIIDIVPTVCDLLDMDPPEDIQGRSMAAFLSDSAMQAEDRFLYCESLYPTKYEANSLLGLIGTQWKYIQTTRPELYDLQEDPSEQTNLVDKRPEQARVLKEHLAETLEQTVRVNKGQTDGPLDPELLRHLKSLGYVAGGSVKEDFSFDQSKRDPKDLIEFHNQFRKATDLVEKNKLAEGRALAEGLIGRYSDVPKLYELLAGAALNQRDHDAAIRYGEEALALESGRMEVRYNLGLAYARSGQHLLAVTEFEEVLALMQNTQATSPARLADVRSQLGMSMTRLKRFEEAIAQFEAALKINPKQPHVLNSLAWLLVNCPDPSLRDPARAMGLAQQACVQTQSKHPVYLNTLAAAHITMGQFTEAIKALERALALASERGDQVLVAKLKKRLDLAKAESTRLN